MTVEEVKAHPEYPHVLWDLKPTQKGKIAAAKGRGGPFEMAYEVHGRGPLHLVVGLCKALIHESFAFGTSSFDPILRFL